MMCSRLSSNIVELLLVLGGMHISHELFFTRSVITGLVVNLFNSSSHLFLDLMDCLLLLVRVKMRVIYDSVSKLV